MICSRPSHLVSLLILFLAVVAPLPGVEAASFDLAADWSDAANPNGVWSYNGSPGVPITNHVADWDPGSGTFLGAQPAWAAAAAPNPGHVPVWLKSVGAAAAGVDLPASRVGMHGSETASAGVTWTSPSDGIVDVDGGTWQFVKVGAHASRSMQWDILKNGVLLTSGVIQGSDTFTSASPFDFSAGSGGVLALQNIAVGAGDVITLQYTKLSSAATFAGVDLTVNLIPEPGTAILALLGGLVVLSRKRARGALGRPYGVGSLRC